LSGLGRTVLCLVAAVAAAGFAGGAGAAANPEPAQASLSDTRVITFTSAVNGRPYRLQVAMPFLSPPPAGGYSVLYVIDGDAYFFTAAEMARTVAQNTIVVGIGYPTDKAYVEQVIAHFSPLPPILKTYPRSFLPAVFARWYDETPAAGPREAALAARPDYFIHSTADMGGVDDFLKTIETEIKPRIARLAPVNAHDQVLFGHSLAGLTVLHAMFTEPDAFRTYIAASPATWWSGPALQTGETAFSRQVAQGKATPRLMVTIGGDEDLPPPRPADFKGTDADWAKVSKVLGMTEIDQSLVARLQALRGAAGYEVADLVIFPHQGHQVSIWPAMARGLPFAFPHP